MPAVESSCPSAICLKVSQEEVYWNALSDAIRMEQVVDTRELPRWADTQLLYSRKQGETERFSSFVSHLSLHYSCLLSLLETRVKKQYR